MAVELEPMRRKVRRLEDRFRDLMVGEGWAGSNEDWEFRPKRKRRLLPTPGPCSCPRDCTEITGFTMSFTVSYLGDGVTSCPADSCSNTQTWTRIDHANSFTAPQQFKLYTDTCNVGTGTMRYEDNRSASPIGFDCNGSDPSVPVHGSFVYGANSPNTGGCCSFVTVGNDVFYTMDFFAEGDSLCSNCVAELGDTAITGLTTCSMASLKGTYHVSNTCVDGFGGQWTIDATLVWF